MKTLTIGYSPCPNDTFIFYGLVHGKINTGDLRFKEILFDVETLNKKAIKGAFDITKVSYHAFASLRKDYCLLRSGGAMGKGCGPLIVAKEKYSMEDLKGKKIAIPGRLTTAYLLLQLYDPSFRDNIKVMRFDEILRAVDESEVDAGLIIHESRFTYKQYRLKLILDLGRWWEEKTGLPLPLGGIIVKKTLGKALIRKIQGLIRESVLYALANPFEPMQYIKKHSQELNDSVIAKHIRLYVNDYSIDIGRDGIKAVKEMFGMAEKKGIIKKGAQGLLPPFFKK